MGDDDGVLEFPLQPARPTEQIISIHWRSSPDEPIEVHTERGYGLFLGRFICISQTWNAERNSDINTMFNLDTVVKIIQEDVPVAN